MPAEMPAIRFTEQRFAASRMGFPGFIEK